jgi:2-polyprenyl-3-methyl-5-hydroxy-6-metoxy-1,4-benzoquinol methylase
MTFEQALHRLSAFEAEIPRLYASPLTDYRGRVIDAKTVRAYLDHEKYRFAEVASMLPPPSSAGMRLLDVGIAYGFLASLIQSDEAWKCEGLELEENISVYCGFAKAKGIKIHPGKLGLKLLPFGDGVFHGILFSEVLEHLRLSPAIILDEFRRILAPTGCLILTTPNIARLTNILKLITGRNVLEEFPDHVKSENITEHLTHIREYTMGELEILL